MEEPTSVAAPLSHVQEPLVAMPMPQQQAGVPSSVVPANLVPAAAAVVNASAASLPHSVFSTATVDVPAAMSLGNLTTYNEVVNKLNRLFEDQTRDTEALTDDHWKSQEFPLARIKKIMRMDEDVKMISAEVPIMFSKAVEIFITELTLRSWMHTEEAKRRTVQRTDIAMAITKNDMFDFLIDIVPREEIQIKTKTALKGSESENVQLLSPDLLQLCLQQLAQQTVASAGAGGEEEEGQLQATATATKLVEQQLHLLQQLINLQQIQQAQDLEQPHQLGSGGTVHLQHPPQDQPLEQPHALSAAGMAVGTHPVTSIDLSGVVQPQATQAVSSLLGGQQTLHHVNVSIPSAADVVEQQLLTAQSQQQQPGTATVVQQLLEGAQGTQQQQQPAAALMDAPPLPTGQYQLQHLSVEQQQEIRQLQQVVDARQIILPAEQQVVDARQIIIPAEQQQLPEHFPGSGQQASEGEVVEFRHIPESESISRSISPIAASLQSAANEGVLYASHAQQTVPIPTSSSSSGGACVLQPPASGAIETVGTTVTLRNLQSNMPAS